MALVRRRWLPSPHMDLIVNKDKVLLAQIVSVKEVGNAVYYRLHLVASVLAKGLGIPRQYPYTLTEKRCPKVWWKHC
jgi:hypothetical protein